MQLENATGLETATVTSHYKLALLGCGDALCCKQVFASPHSAYTHTRRRDTRRVGTCVVMRGNLVAHLLCEDDRAGIVKHIVLE